MRDSAARPVLGAGGGGWEAVARLGPRAKRSGARARRLGGRGFRRVFFRRFLRGFPAGFSFFAGGAGFLLLPRSPVGELECRGFGDGAALAGAGLFVDGFEVVFDDMGVDLGGLDAAVAEHFLDVPDAGSAAQHAGGAGVTQAVGGRAGGKMVGGGVAADEAQEPCGGEGVAAFCEEEKSGGGAGFGLGNELRVGFG